MCEILHFQWENKLASFLLRVSHLQVNLLGRLILPLISDLIGARKPLFCLSLAVQAVCLACLPTALDEKSYGGVITCAFIIGFFCKWPLSFTELLKWASSVSWKSRRRCLSNNDTSPFADGGGFGMIPAFLADQFGAKNVGKWEKIIERF